MRDDSPVAVRFEAALTIGYLAVTLALVAAYTRPAAGYELSIYDGTPLTFWVGIALAALVATYVSTSLPRSRRHVQAALLLVTLCVVAVVALPLLRSYTFYGGGDSLSHLGWARELMSGVIEPTAVVYPGVHLVASLVSRLTGLELTRTLQLVPLVVFPLVYVVFSTLCVRTITDSRWASVMGVLLAVLFVPINQIGIHFVAHPSSQTVMFLPLALYVLLRYLGEDGEGASLTTPFGLLLVLVGFAMLLLHPQETLTFVSLMGGIWLFQSFVRRSWPSHHVASHRSVFAHLLALGLTFVVWTAQHGRAVGRLSFVLTSIFSGGPTTLQEAETRGSSLAALGGSFEELFLKLFGVTVVVMAIAGGLVLANTFRQLDPSKRARNALIWTLSAGLVFPSIGFVVIFVADQGDHYFRFLGFIMVAVTVLGAVALAEMAGSLERRLADIDVPSVGVHRQVGDGGHGPTPSALATGLTVLVVVLLAAQVAVAHQSPYVYQPNKQVTAAEMEGHRTMLELQDGRTEFTGLRSGPERFVDVYYGTETAERRAGLPSYGDGITGRYFGSNLTDFENEDFYLVLTEAEYRKEVELYHGLRFSERGFLTIERHQNASRVQDNGAVRLYRVHAD
jgi:hypothetical protein